MKLGIVGLSGAGKSTVFEALTKNVENVSHKGENRIGTIYVPDERVDFLSDMYKPKKTTYAQNTYLLPGHGEKKTEKDLSLNQIRDCDAQILVVRNFSGYGMSQVTPLGDFNKFNQELIFTDLVVIEKRIERLEIDQKRGKKVEPELSLIKECKKILESEIPLRKHPELASEPIFRGFAFLSAKPMLILFNNNDEDTKLPEEVNLLAENCMVIRGKIEQEIAKMTEEDAKDFMSEFDIEESAMARVIKKSYDILGLISFFTVGEDEVKAWTIKKGTSALDAAEVIHSDIKKGFIRAEVLAYDDLKTSGSFQEAKKKAHLRLEGKGYEVKDGDIIHFRFNV
ncbi:MAG: redox-regulated ATPase YchF [Desulfobacterales bacterium]|nr:redox-regulated ATPase YchF [Desulfobacterales bacterium]MBF0397365.1 redox-regulated ATPase YchF [Desulfobacterales bacterium]